MTTLKGPALQVLHLSLAGCGLQSGRKVQSLWCVRPARFRAIPRVIRSRLGLDLN